MWREVCVEGVMEGGVCGGGARGGGAAVGREGAR